MDNIKLRKTNLTDINDIYNLQYNCFEFGDRWYKQALQEYILNGFVIEYNNTIIAFILYGSFIPLVGSEYIINIDNKLYNNTVDGIVMLCVDLQYRRKGLATLLITEYLKLNKNTSFIITRTSNTDAYNLYIKLGYELIGNIKEKYYLPLEDGCLLKIN